MAHKPGGGYVLEDKQLPQEIIVRANTELGFDVAKVGDSIDYSQPNSKTRRGRVGVGVGVAHTLDTQVNQAVVIAQRGRGEKGNIKQQFEERKDGKTNTLTGVQKDNLIIDVGHKNEGIIIYDNTCPTLQSRDYKEPKIVCQLNKSIESNGSQPYQQNRVYDIKGLSPTLDSRSDSKNVNIGYNIRRLTEVECERLQGFPDQWTEYGIYEKQVWINKKLKTFEIVEEKHKIPKAQRYKLIGNAVTRDIIELIGKKLLKNKSQ